MSREAVLSRLRVMGVTMVAIFAASVLFGATLNAGFSWYNAYASIGTAALIGLPIFTFEMFFVNSPLGAGFRRWPFARFVAVRCAAWLAWIFVATQLSLRWLWSTEEAPWAGADLWWTIAFSFAVGLSVVSALTRSTPRYGSDKPVASLTAPFSSPPKRWRWSICRTGPRANACRRRC